MSSSVLGPSVGPSNSSSTHNTTTPTASQPDSLHHNLKLKKIYSLAGYQEIADFINANLPGADLTIDHVHPSIREKAGVILEAKTTRAESLLEPWEEWTLSTPWAEIIAAGELNVTWDADGPRPPPEVEAQPGELAEEGKKHYEEEEDGELPGRNQEGLKRKREEIIVKVPSFKYPERAAQQLAAAEMVAEFINEKLPGADVTAKDITKSKLRGRGITVVAKTRRAGYVAKIHRANWPRELYINMREVLDGGEIEVVPTPEKVREDRNDKSTFNSSPPDVSRAREGESRGTPETEQDSASESESSDESDSDHPKSSRPFAPRPPQRKEWELNVKSKIAKFINISLPGAKVTPEQIVPTTLRLHCGIILQATTPRAEGFANKSSARWLRTQSIDDIINKGELIPTWDKLGPIDPWLDEESDGEDSDETVSKKQKLNSQEPLARAYRKRFEHWGKALIANMINEQIPGANVTHETTHPSELMSSHDIYLEATTDRAKPLARPSWAWKHTTPIEEVIQAGELVARYDLKKKKSLEKKRNRITAANEAAGMTSTQDLNFGKKTKDKQLGIVREDVAGTDVEGSRELSQVDTSSDDDQLLKPPRKSNPTPHSNIIPAAKESAVKKVIGSPAMRKVILDQTKRLIAGYIKTTLPGARVGYAEITPGGLQSAGIKLLAATPRAAMLLRPAEEWKIDASFVHEIFDGREIVAQWARSLQMMTHDKGMIEVGILKEMIKIAKMESGEEKEMRLREWWENVKDGGLVEVAGQFWGLMEEVELLRGKVRALEGRTGYESS